MKLIRFINQFKVLSSILILASVLRLWNLSNIPPHLRNDEAALGYNAFSILKTLKDEHGEFLPLIFESFGDWKMGFYIYMTLPFVAWLGLNELSTRLPSAISGILAVWLFYQIVLQMFVTKRLALIAAFVFTLSPIYIIFSRGAWEVNVSLTLTLAGIFFFLKAVNGKDKLLLLSTLFFGLTFLTSHTAKLSTPLLLLILFFTYFHQIRKIAPRLILVSILIGLIFAIPVGLSFAQGRVARITTLNIFSYYSNPLSAFSSVAIRWFSLYSGSTLFIKGDTNPQHGAPNSGPLLLLESVFLTLGIIKLIRLGNKQQNIFIWSSLVLLSFPSALTIEKINFERVLPMFVPILILTSLGIDYLWGKFKKAKFILMVFILLYLINYTYFLDQYFIHGVKKNDAWQYGYKQIVEKITPLQHKYDQIIVAQGLEHPYIFFLFYQKYDPQKYQDIVKDVFIPNQEGKEMGLVLAIDNIKFAPIDWTYPPLKNTIYVMPNFTFEQQSKLYSSYKELDIIYDLDGFPLFKIVETI